MAEGEKYRGLAKPRQACERLKRFVNLSSAFGVEFACGNYMSSLRCRHCRFRAALLLRFKLWVVPSFCQAPFFYHKTIACPASFNLLSQPTQLRSAPSCPFPPFTRQKSSRYGHSRISETRTGRMRPSGQKRVNIAGSSCVGIDDLR